MSDTEESGGRATRRQVLQAARGALAVGTLLGRGAVQASNLPLFHWSGNNKRTLGQGRGVRV
jgi:hypothetical protein